MTSGTRLGDAAEHRDDPRGRGRVVDVGRPVDGRDRVRPGQPVARRAQPRHVEPVEVGEQRVDHRVADEVDPARVDALAAQVGDALRARHEEESAEEVGDDAG